MGFNLDNYEPVATRLQKFIETANGPRVITEMVHRGDGWCVFKASLYAGDILLSTGWAEEHATDRGVNMTSHVENCETSAVGRALANYGFAGSDPARRASREEMQKVARVAGAFSGATLTEHGAPVALATDPQKKMLRALSRALKRDLPNLDAMTKREASQMIEQWKSEAGDDF